MQSKTGRSVIAGDKHCPTDWMELHDQEGATFDNGLQASIWMPVFPSMGLWTASEAKEVPDNSKIIENN